MPAKTETVRHARTARLPCRKSKRRCDKRLPSCELCKRKDIECRFPVRHGRDTTPSQDPASLSHLSLFDKGQTGLFPSIRSGARAVYFIAPRIFHEARLELPRLDLPIPAEAASQLGDNASIRTIATNFFMSVHRWLPFISKRVFFACLLNPLAQRQTELSLLALSMKLCCTAPSDGEAAHGNVPALYHVAKRFYFEVENAGILSMPVLEAGILIAFYELSQAIYPAAYLTVGTCARYGLALGVDKLCLGLVKNIEVPQSWNDIEEQRRAWWAVVVLDRFLSLSNPSRALSTEDPTFDAFLPIDDAAWDEQKGSAEDAVRISTGCTLEMGSFARLAQATYLLSKSLRTMAQGATEGHNMDADEAVQLRRTLLALVHVTDSESTVRRLEYCAQSALCLSTILLLQEHHSLKEADDNAGEQKTTFTLDDLWYETRTALDRLSGAAVAHYTTSPDDPQSSSYIPIFLIHALYQVACMYTRLAQDTSDEQWRAKTKPLLEWLQLIDTRWRLAGVYLNILNAQDLSTSSHVLRAG